MFKKIQINKYHSDILNIDIIIQKISTNKNKNPIETIIKRQKYHHNMPIGKKAIIQLNSVLTKDNS